MPLTQQGRLLEEAELAPCGCKKICHPGESEPAWDGVCGFVARQQVHHLAYGPIDSMGPT